MKKITSIRKAVCIMANELKKAGYSLAQAFRKAWSRVKCSMTIRAKGTTFENRQECLVFLKQFQKKELPITLEREAQNESKGNAVRIVVHIPKIQRKTVIGYVPKGISKEVYRLLDAGIEVKAYLMDIIGGYSYKENLGALVNITI